MSLDFQRVRDEYPLTEVVSRYVLIQKKGPQYWGLCPFHEDKKPNNFNVYRGKDGVERYRCFVCDSGGDVIDFVAAIEHCTKAEAVEKITGKALPAIGEYTPKKLPPNETAAWIPIIPVPRDAPGYKPELTFNPNRNRLVNYQGLLERMDPYHDQFGALLFWVVKLRFPDGAKACPTITYCGGPGAKRKWCAKRMPAPYPLMGLDGLALHPTRHIMIVSGEMCKAEHDANAALYIAVTWLGGDGAVEKTDWSPLVGRKYNFYPDDDESGRKAMRKIQQIIEKSGTG